MADWSIRRRAGPGGQLSHGLTSLADGHGKWASAFAVAAPLGLGTAAAFASNVAHGLGHEPLGAAAGGSSAFALVGRYELLMMIVRGVHPPGVPDGADAPAPVPPVDSLHARAAEEFPGRTPSIRAAPGSAWASPRAQQVRAYLAARTCADVHQSRTEGGHVVRIVGAENLDYLGRCPTERGRFGQALSVGRADLGPAGGGMIFGLWA